MRRFKLGFALVTSGCLGSTSLCLAQSPAPPASPSTPTDSAPAPVSTTRPVAPAVPVAPAATAPAVVPPVPTASPAPARVLGPSPYSALIQKGDGAYIARDFDTAIAAYREELQKNPSAASAHFRLGQAQLAKGDSAEAEASWQTALRFADKDPAQKSKVLFVLADLKEREKSYDEAIARWKAYQEQAQAQPDEKGIHPATAAERLKRIEEWKANAEASAAVRARIEKRLKEVDESLRKSSK